MKVRVRTSTEVKSIHAATTKPQMHSTAWMPAASVVAVSTLKRPKNLTKMSSAKMTRTGVVTTTNSATGTPCSGWIAVSTMTERWMPAVPVAAVSTTTGSTTLRTCTSGEASTTTQQLPRRLRQSLQPRWPLRSCTERH